MSMIYPMNQVLEKNYLIKEDFFLQQSKIKNLLLLISGLCKDFDTKCEVLTLEEPHQLWILFPNSCVDCSSFTHEYKEVLYDLQRQFNLAIHGVSEAHEPACLVFKQNENQLNVEYQNISGEAFQQLYYIHLQIDYQEEIIGEFLKTILANFNINHSLLIVEPKWRHLLFEQQLFEENCEQYYYDYIALQEIDEFEREVIDTLSLTQIAKLWELFLNEQITTYELSLFDHYLQNRSQKWLFQLEISLRLALVNTQTKVELTNQTFEIWHDNKRLWLDAHSGSIGEKLFLKILFPVKRRF